MTRYLISFDDGAMTFPEEDLPDVAEAAHAVVQEAKDAGVWVFGGGLHSHEEGAWWPPTGRSPTAHTLRARRTSADSRLSTFPHARRRWRGPAGSPSPAVVRRRFASSCPALRLDQGHPREAAEGVSASPIIAWASVRECHQSTTRAPPLPATRLARVEVRPEAIRDRSAVRALHVAAFGEDHVPVVANLVDELRDAVTRGEGLSLVAAERDQIVGHVMFSPSLLDAPKRLLPVQVLSPIGVAPARQNQGVGSALIRRGLELLSERDVPLVFLEGAPGYYSRFGFEPGAAHGFRKPSLRIPDAAFQVLRLPAYEPWMTGTLVYSEVFWTHDAVGRRDPDS